MKLLRQVRLAMLAAGLLALLVGVQPAAASTTATNYFHRNGTYDPYPPTATTPTPLSWPTS